MDDTEFATDELSDLSIREGDVGAEVEETDETFVDDVDDPLTKAFSDEESEVSDDDGFTDDFLKYAGYED